MIIKELLNRLIAAGTTTAAENIPALYKIGMGLDSESTTITHTETRGKRRPKVYTLVDNCFCYSWQFAFNKDNAVIVRTLTHIINVLIDVVDTVKAANKVIGTDAIFIIWCANLSHEWSFLKAAICNQFEITRAFAKSPRDILFAQIESCIELRECLGLFGHSLDDIAKNWCSADNQKLTGTFDYDKVRTYKTELDNDTEIPYMKHDVTTLAEMHEKVIAAYTQTNGVCRLPYTSSGFVRLALKDSIRNDDDLTALREQYNFNRPRRKPIETNIEYLKKINERVVTDLAQWTICREFGYSGGLCGSNLKTAGVILSNVVCADLTSDYPAQLSHNKYPAGKLTAITTGDLNDIKEELDRKSIPYFAILKIEKIKAKTQHATFSKHKIINKESMFFKSQGEPRNLICYNGKVHSGENLIVCWNDVDIKAYKKIYHIKAAVLTLWKFDSYKRLPDWFLQTLWTAYAKKAELKNAGIKSGVVYDDAKRIPNSIYGVLATRLNDTYDTIDTDYNFKVGKEKSFDKIRRDFWLNPYYAFWCTSYARAILMDFLSKYPDCIVQYDTDSLYYIKSKGERLEKALLKYNDNILKKNRRIFKNADNPTLFETLGQWDFDDVYKKFLGLGAKKYIKQDSAGNIHTVIAGLPKDAIPAEIESSGIAAPFDYYNPVVKWLTNEDNAIIIKHAFAHKFASVYNDDTFTHYEEITDYKGVKAFQDVGCYHAIIPIDFTLSMAKDYIMEIVKGRQ